MRRTALTTLVMALALAATARASPIAGVVPDIPTARSAHGRVPAHAHLASVGSGGGPVLHSNRTHLILWQPAGSGFSFDAGYGQLIETFLAQVAADSRLSTNLYALTGQYRDSGGPAAYDSTFGGTVLDTDPVPVPYGCSEPPPPPLGTGPGWTACVSDQQIQTEISHVVAAHGLPTSQHDVYFLVTPAGLGSCQQTGPDNCALGGPSGGYCGYHSVTFDTGLLYAVLPYNAVAGRCHSDNPRPNASTADPTISTLAHEHAEVITDPFGTAWIDNQGNEVADLCRTNYGPRLGGSGSDAYNELIHGGRYYIQELWSNADGACAPSAQPDRVTFTAPRGVPGDRWLSLSASASDPQGRIVADEWSFGDGQGAVGRHVAHAFTRAGSFTVLLRATDSWGNRASAARVVQVSVPPPPATRIVAGPRRLTHARRSRFRFRSDASFASFQCRIDQAAWSPCGSPYTTASLSAGAHRFSVRASDSFGQLERRPPSYRFTVL